MPVYSEEELFGECEQKSSKVSKVLKGPVFESVFEALKNYIDNQIENGKACSIGGFGKWTFRSEKMDLGTQGIVEKRYPVFLLSENFARANNLRVSRPFVSSEIPVVEVNYFLLAQRASTMKEIVTAAFKIMFALLGDRMGTGRQVSIDFKVGKLTSDKKLVDFQFAPKYAEPIVMRRDGSGSLPSTPALPQRPASAGVSRGRLMTPLVHGGDGATTERARTSGGLFRMPLPSASVEHLVPRGVSTRSSETNVMTIHHEDARDSLDEVADIHRLSKSLEIDRAQLTTPSRTYEDYRSPTSYLEDQMLLKEAMERRRKDEYLYDGEKVAKSAHVALMFEQKRQEDRRRELMAIAEENKRIAAEKSAKDKGEREFLFGTDFAGHPKGGPSPSHHQHAASSPTSESKFYMPYEDDDEISKRKAAKAKELRESLDNQIQLRQAIYASRAEHSRAEEELEREEQMSTTRASQVGSPVSRASSNPLAASLPSAADSGTTRRMLSEPLIMAAMDEAMMRQHRLNQQAAESEARTRIRDEKAHEASRRYERMVQEERKRRDAANAEFLQKQIAEARARKESEDSERKLPTQSVFRTDEKTDDRRARTRSDLVAQMEENEKRRQRQRENELAMELALIEKANKELEDEHRLQLARKMESTAILAESWKRQMQLRSETITPRSPYSSISRGSLR